MWCECYWNIKFIAHLADAHLQKVWLLGMVKCHDHTEQLSMINIPMDRYASWGERRGGDDHILSLSFLKRNKSSRDREKSSIWKNQKWFVSLSTGKSWIAKVHTFNKIIRRKIGNKPKKQISFGKYIFHSLWKLEAFKWPQVKWTIYSFFKTAETRSRVSNLFSQSYINEKSLQLTKWKISNFSQL